MDGLRFTSGPLDVAAGRRRVAVGGDLHASAPVLRASLAPAIAAALVHCARPLSARWPDPERVAEAAGFAAWLASLLPASDPGLQSLRAQALYTAHVLTGHHAEAWNDAGLAPADPEVTAMASAAIALEKQELDHLVRMRRADSNPAVSQSPLRMAHHQRLSHAREVLFTHNRRRIEGQIERVERVAAALSLELAEARAHLQGLIDALAVSLGDLRPEPPLAGPGLSLLLETAALPFEDGTPLPPDGALACALRPRGLRQRPAEPALVEITWVPLAAARLVSLANALDRASREGEPAESVSSALESIQGPLPTSGELGWTEAHERLRALVLQLPAQPAAAVGLSAMLAAHLHLGGRAQRWLASRLAGSRLRLCLWHQRLQASLDVYSAEIAARDPELAIDLERRRIGAVLAEVLADQDAALRARGLSPVAGVTPTLSSLGRALPWQDTLFNSSAKDQTCPQDLPRPSTTSSSK